MLDRHGCGHEKRVGGVRVSSLGRDITVPGRPEVQEVSAGVYAYVQPDGSC